jgi:hypothetical protein
MQCLGNVGPSHGALSILCGRAAPWLYLNRFAQYLKGYEPARRANLAQLALMDV